MPYNRSQTKDYDWSPDGRSLIYCSANAGLWNVWQVSADGTGEPQQLSTNTDPKLKLCGPRFSPDGQQIAYVASLIKPPSGAKTLTKVCLLTGEKSATIFASASVLKLIAWTRPGDHLIVAELEGKDTPEPATARLLQVSAAGNNWNEIAQIDSAYFDNIQLSPDGRMIAFASRADGKDNLRVISSAGGESRKIIESSDPNVYIASIAWSPDGQAIYYSKQRRVGLISMLENFN